MIHRTYEQDDFTVHRVPLMLMGAVVAVSVALAASVSLGLFERQGIAAEARAATGTQAMGSRSIFFIDEPEGWVRVEDAQTGSMVGHYPPEIGGFVRSTARSLVHKRQARGIGPAQPFELTEWDNGNLTLSDPATGYSVELAFFGKDNRAIFADILEGKLR
ncbi:MAG: photosynthetic complex assembly protein PuhC [Erythrobacter sp.]|uniref:photosynthetic complex assembly protein PuhC n=1 Tax=Erythrobacter sp. TaxID=1042 RepID=UPI003C783816